MMMLAVNGASFSHDGLAGLMGGVLLLVLAVLGLLTWSVRNLTSTSRALKLHADVNSSLNDELRHSYEARRELREKNEALAERVDDLEANARLQQERLTGLQADKGRLTDALAALHAEADQRERTHQEVVDALTGQIAQLKLALQQEKDARQRGEDELRRQIEQLTAQNAALIAAARSGPRRASSEAPHTPDHVTDITKAQEGNDA